MWGKLFPLCETLKWDGYDKVPTKNRFFYFFFFEQEHVLQEGDCTFTSQCKLGGRHLNKYDTKTFELSPELFAFHLIFVACVQILCF